MNRKVSIALVVTLLPALFLYLWKLTYDFSDWAVLWLLFLAVMIFLGSWSIVIDHWKAERGIVLRPESWISDWLTGRIWAFLSSLLLVLAVVPTLAWQVLKMPTAVAIVFLAIAFSSAWLFLSMQSLFARHFMPPFDKIFATGPSAWLIGLPFSAILFLVTWYEPTNSTEVLRASFSETVQVALSRLPERRGWIAEFLALGYAFEASKLWVAVQLREYRLFALLINLDSAVLGFFAARACVVVTHFVETHYGKGSQ